MHCIFENQPFGVAFPFFPFLAGTGTAAALALNSADQS